ncbi:LINE-1 retrotransposable element ORF1 protein [Holothuria leucospilota]|uniref:LINE-1 retrotransposable element ORF1 protein n=1 Tax=Holothuria leucospilota TaxID=206669 RepID=A0A9Q0YAK0_HOLLE|nr:LINE-1 retrotransposable element ORF1 protein [Holothuria leucospilota]
MEKSLRRIGRDVKHINDELGRIEKEFGKAVEFLSKRVDQLEKQDKLLEKKVEELERVNHEQADLINVQERFSRRSNLRIVGYPAAEGENCIEIAKSVLEEVGVTNPKIERAHRDGRLHPTRPRHLLVKLSFYQDKITALKYQREKLNSKDYFLTDDLTRVDLQEKRKWRRQVSQLFQEGTRLRFTAGKWRDRSGKPYPFAHSPV